MELVTFSKRPLLEVSLYSSYILDPVTSSSVTNSIIIDVYPVYTLVYTSGNRYHI